MVSQNDNHQDPAITMLDYSTRILSNCQPLFDKIPQIKNFKYDELDPKGNLFILSSDVNFLEKFFQNKFHLDVVNSFTSSHLHVGFYLLDGDKKALKKYSKFINFCEEFCYGHTLRFVMLDKVGKTPIIRRFGFEADLTAHEVNNIYINKLDLIKNFFKSILPIVITAKKEITPFQFDHQRKRLSDYFATFNSELPDEPNKKILNITQREREILEWLIQGKSAEETGIILGLARKTVEFYFERLRKKFECGSKHQVILKAKSLGLLDI